MPRVPTSMVNINGMVFRTTTKVPAYPIDYHNNVDALSVSEIQLQATASARSQGVDPGNIIQDVVFFAGANKIIEHKLQRSYLGFIVRRTRGNHPISFVEVNQNNPTLDKVQITLNSHTDCIADIEVY